MNRFTFWQKIETQKLTQYQPSIYQIKVPGALDESWVNWGEGMKTTVESSDDGFPVTTLTITVDQAALQGLLRHLYSLGLPLISVICVGCEGKQTHMVCV